MDCSVIISTNNRASSLEATLRAFGEVQVPEGWAAELIVVDNASTDNTSAVVNAATLRNFRIRYLYWGLPGKSNALNAALAIAEGDVLLFTDDDVVPTSAWLTKLAEPLRRRECDGVVGRIQLAKHLWRPWMEASHRHRLAAPDEPSSEVIGANMGFHRSVFDRVSGFDPELGPGASGLGEETLFAMQLEVAGCHVKAVADAIVTHHPEPSRLIRSHWLEGSCKHGRTSAYILHHWEHGMITVPHLRLLYTQIKLSIRRLIQPPPALTGEGCPPWEMSYVAEIEKYQHFLRERQRPRNYSQRGLRKLTAEELSAGGRGLESVD